MDKKLANFTASPQIVGEDATHVNELVHWTDEGEQVKVGQALLDKYFYMSGSA